jgi:hypothetical protein
MEYFPPLTIILLMALIVKWLKWLETINGKPPKAINIYDQSRLGVILCSMFCANSTS